MKCEVQHARSTKISDMTPSILSQLWKIFDGTYNFLYTVSRSLWTRDELVKKSLPTNRTRERNINTQISVPRVGFEPTNPAFKRAKRVHSSGCASTMTGAFTSCQAYIAYLPPCLLTCNDLSTESRTMVNRLIFRST
jgi:hypothetical protein